MPRREILRGKSRIEALFRAGKKIRTRHLQAVFARSDDAGEPVRVVFCVSRRFGGAVRRNLLRRRLKEIYRQHKPARANLLLAMVPLAGCQNLPYAALAAEWRELGERLVGAP